MKINPTTGIEPFPVDDEFTSSFNKSVELVPVCGSSTSTNSSNDTSQQVDYWRVMNQKGSGKNAAKEDDGITLLFILDTFSKSLSMFSSV